VFQGHVRHQHKDLQATEKCLSLLKSSAEGKANETVYLYFIARIYTTVRRNPLLDPPPSQLNPISIRKLNPSSVLGASNLRFLCLFRGHRSALNVQSFVILNRRTDIIISEAPSLSSVDTSKYFLDRPIRCLPLQ
jgi:hypothetical protein